MLRRFLQILVLTAVFTTLVFASGCTSASDPQSDQEPYWMGKVAN